MSNIRSLTQFEQANARLKLLAKQWYDGKIDRDAYRAERREILLFLSGEQIPEKEQSPEPLTLEAFEEQKKATTKRWWQF